MLSSLQHWLQPITNSNVIVSSTSDDQRLMSRLGTEWFPEDSEEHFDMGNAKTSQAYPSLPLIHGMMLRLSPVSRLENTHTHADRQRVIHTSPLSVFIGISQLWQLIPSMSACAAHLPEQTDWLARSGDCHSDADGLKVYIKQHNLQGSRIFIAHHQP